MKPEKLKAMANQIVIFFRSHTEAEAVAGTKRHVVSFWTPEMLAVLDRRLGENDAGAGPPVRLAFRRPAVAGSPVERVTSPGREAGQLASDAG